MRLRISVIQGIVFRVTVNTFLFLLVYMHAEAQRTMRILPTLTYAEWTLKTPLTSLLNTDQHLTLALEARPHPHVGFQFALGYIFNSIKLNESYALLSVSGIRTSLEARYYDKSFYSNNWMRYLGVQWMFKHVEKRLESYESVGNYRMLKTTDLRKQAFSFALIGGWQKSKGVLPVDFTLGIGLRHKWLDIHPEIERSSRQYPARVFGELLSGYYPHVVAGINLQLHLSRPIQRQIVEKISPEG